MVLTVRKFVSLLVSIVFFGNAWSVAHWLGTVCVFGGAVVYSTDFMSRKKQD
jgi:drug/metabolite transporter (DMT)-like permease